MKILIVDDESLMREMVSDVLLGEELFQENEVFVACNGVEGLKLYHEIKPDIVLTDMLMPEMNGSQLIEEISKINRNCEFIIMTGYADLEMAMKVMKEGVNEMIRKPFQAEELINAVNKILEKNKLEEQNKDYKQKLIKAEKLSSIGLLAAGIAHEINNPNTFIKGNLELLLKYMDIVEPYLKKELEKEGRSQNTKLKIAATSFRSAILSALNGSERIKNIVAGLLSFSRSSSLEVKEVYVKDLIESALLMISFKAKKYTIERIIPDENLKVKVNEQDIVQSLMNLVVNAIDAIEEKKEKKIEPEYKGKIKITAGSENQYIKLLIEDNGIGMDQEVLDKIFDPFFTTKPQGKGTGLGISIVKGNIEGSAGLIQIQSKKNKGTTVTILLPKASG